MSQDSTRSPTKQPVQINRTRTTFTHDSPRAKPIDRHHVIQGKMSSILDSSQGMRSSPSVLVSKPLFRSQSSKTVSSNAQKLQDQGMSANGTSLLRSKTTVERDLAPKATMSKKLAKSPLAIDSKTCLTQSTVSNPESLAASSSRGQISSPLSRHTSTPDQLQEAAQMVSWAYMLHSLEESFNEAELRARSILSQWAQEITHKELEASEKQERFRLERLTDLYNELSNNKVASDVVDSFLAQGEECTELINKVLQLARNPELVYNSACPMAKLNTQLRQIVELHERLQDTINVMKGLSSIANPGRLLQSCIPLLEARTRNLDTAFAVLQAVKAQVIASLQLEVTSVG